MQLDLSVTVKDEPPTHLICMDGINHVVEVARKKTNKHRRKSDAVGTRFSFACYGFSHVHFKTDSFPIDAVYLYRDGISEEHLVAKFDPPVLTFGFDAFVCVCTRDADHVCQETH